MTTHYRPWRAHSSSTTAADLWYRVVLQICHCQNTENRALAVLTLPDKIRHSAVAKIEIAISMILSDGATLLHNGFNNAWWYNRTSLIVE